MKIFTFFLIILTQVSFSQNNKSTKEEIIQRAIFNNFFSQRKFPSTISENNIYIDSETFFNSIEIEQLNNFNPHNLLHNPSSILKGFLDNFEYWEFKVLINASIQSTLTCKIRISLNTNKPSVDYNETTKDNSSNFNHSISLVNPLISNNSACFIITENTSTSLERSHETVHKFFTKEKLDWSNLD